jgi:hypothetical protein
MGILKLGKLTKGFKPREIFQRSVLLREKPFIISEEYGK